MTRDYETLDTKTRHAVDEAWNKAADALRAAGLKASTLDPAERLIDAITSFVRESNPRDRLRQGIVVEQVTSGCDCRRLSAMPSTHYGDTDFHNTTEGMKVGSVSSDPHNTGVCPICQAEVEYIVHRIVTADTTTDIWAK